MNKGKDDESEETIHADLSELSVLAQLMGYTLESFELCPKLQNLKGVKIEITCYKSGIRSVLRSKSDTICSCPPKDVLEKGQILQVLGLGPSILHPNETYIGTSSGSLWPKISNSTARMITGLLKPILWLINNTEAVKNEDIAKCEPQPKTSTPDRHQSNVAKRSQCAKCSILKSNLKRMENIINESLDNAPLQELQKTFTQAPNISVRLSDIKPGEGPSVKCLKEVQAIKGTVKSSAPKGAPLAPKGTIKAGTTPRIARIIKTGKTIGTPNSRLPKRKG